MPTPIMLVVVGSQAGSLNILFVENVNNNKTVNYKKLD